MLSRVVRCVYYKSGFRPPARSSLPRESVYAGRYLAEVVQLLSGAEADDGVVGIGWLQADTALVAAVGLHGEVAVHAGDDHVAVGWAERAVNDEQVAVADPRADHRVALDAHEVRGGRTLYQKFIQVKRRLQVLFGWRREPRYHRS